MADFTGLLGVPGHSCSSGATDPIFSTQRIPRWGDPIGGGLRIVSGEHVRIVSGEHGEIIGGRCVRKSRFSKEETAFAGDAKISSSILMSFSMKDRGTMRQKMSIFKGRNSVCRVQKSLIEF